METSFPLPTTLSEGQTVLPSYAYDGDAGLDLRATEDCVLQPFERKLIGTGISIAIPQGYAGFVLPRSGSAIKAGLSLVNAPGLIDSNYRGEIKAIAINLDAHEPIHIEAGDRIAQLVIMKVENVKMIQTDTLDETTRGQGGFGSSGKN